MRDRSDFSTVEGLVGAQACFAAASQLLYREPDVAGLADLVAARRFADVPFGAWREGLADAAGRLDAWCARVMRESGADTAEGLAASGAFVAVVRDLGSEWLRLLVGLGAPEASCLESSYVEPNGHMFAQCTLDVRREYARHGLRIEGLGREPDDHLALMLGFVSHLIGEEVGALDSGEPARAANLADEQRRFLAKHILPWLAVWNYSMGKHARSEYFRALGDFTFWLCAAYAERFGISYDEKTRIFEGRG